MGSLKRRNSNRLQIGEADMFESKDNELGIFMAVSKHWPKEQREKYLKKMREELKQRDKRENTV